VALKPTRREFRIELHHVDRGVEHSETAIVAQHPSETDAHLVLRVLAWCALHEPEIAFGPGLSTPDAPDVWVRDLTGRVTTWIECGAADAGELKRAVSSGAAVHVVVDRERRAAELTEALGDYKRAHEIAVWLVDAALVDALAANREPRRRWTVTIVGSHFYVQEGSASVDGELRRL
jgi:uncharacterized protein YaeQ